MLTKQQSTKALQQVLQSITLPKLTKKDQTLFLKRLDEHFPPLVEKLYELYGGHYDFSFICKN